MTLAQIEKTREFLKEIKIINDYDSIWCLIYKIQEFYKDKDFGANLGATLSKENYTTERLSDDKEIISCYLESILSKEDKASQVCEILDLIDEGKLSCENKDSMENFISKVYYAYSGKIKFDKGIEMRFTPSKDFLGFYILNVNENMVNGIIFKLKDYANSLLLEKTTVPRTKEPSIQVNNYNTNTANATATNTIDISVAIDNARKQVEDAGLADEQQKAVMDKLAEIEEIAKSKESKGKRWAKAKEVLKWVAEQGIQVAGIILPLLAPMIGL